MQSVREHGRAKEDGERLARPAVGPDSRGMRVSGVFAIEGSLPEMDQGGAVVASVINVNLDHLFLPSEIPTHSLTRSE